MRTQSVFRSPLLAGALLALATTGLLAQGSRRVVFNHFISDPNQTSILYITDAEGTASDIVVDFYTNNGEIIGQRKAQVPANGTISIQPHDVVKRVANGKAVVESKGGRVIGEYWQIIETKEFKYSVAVPGQPALGRDVLFVQHLVSDPAVTGVIYVSDTMNDGDVPVDIEFFDEHGGLMAKTTRSIPSGGTVNIKPYDVLKKKTIGSARVTTGGGPIVGEYWQLVSGTFEDEAGGEKKVNYAVGITARGRINTPLQQIELADRIELVIPVHFDFDSDAVRDVDVPNLEEASKIMKRYDYFDVETITVEGHTDEAGAEDYNLDLSQRRADHVKAYLESNYGVDGGRLRSVGYGESRPVVPGATGNAGQVNRRVVFSIPKE